MVSGGELIWHQFPSFVSHARLVESSCREVTELERTGEVFCRSHSRRFCDCKQGSVLFGVRKSPHTIRTTSNTKSLLCSFIFPLLSKKLLENPVEITVHYCNSCSYPCQFNLYSLCVPHDLLSVTMTSSMKRRSPYSHHFSVLAALLASQSCFFLSLWLLQLPLLSFFLRSITFALFYAD